MGQKTIGGAAVMNGNSIRTFLGANSSEGFFSLYDIFRGTDRTIIIKGGPGSGKSGIMKKIAAESLKRGFFTEYCYCSSDAESIDAIRIPQKGLCITDGTTPHLIEPKFAGAKDEIFYTGQFWDGNKLQKSYEEIKDLSLKISECFGRAYRYLAAAGRMAEDIRKTNKPLVDLEKMKRFAAEMIRRHATKSTGTGRILPRFLSGITPQGSVIHRDTVYTLAEKVFVLEDPYRIGQVFLEAIIETAMEEGHDMYVFYDPLCPSVPEHVALPNGGIAFVTANHFHSFEPQNAYRIHLNRFLKEELPKQDLKHKEEKMIDACLQEAFDSLKREKAYHDDLEEYYIEAMDFRKLNAATVKLIKDLF